MIVLDDIKINRPVFLNGNNWILKDLNHITIIFGKNGSGKSMLLRQIRDLDNESNHYLSPERSGEIKYEMGIANEEYHAKNRANRRKENLSPTFRQEAISRIQTVLTKIGSVSGRGEKHNIDLEEIEQFLESLLINFDFKILDINPFIEIIRKGNNQKITSVNQLSSGESEILSLALDILTICCIWELNQKNKRVLLLDEPDTHLHPNLQQRLANFLIKITDKYNLQMIIATHSTTLLSSLGHYGGENTSVVYLNNSKEEQKVVKFDKTLRELSTCLGGHALMGPLFSTPILLVEGDDDYAIWSQVPRHNITNFAVIPCNGDEIKQYQKHLENIFSCLIESPQILGYALLDGDKSKPDGHSTPQNFVKFIQLNCHESENLYLTNEVLNDVGVKWDFAKDKIKKQSENYGTKTPILNNICSLDKKQGDIKQIIKEISGILDEKKVDWKHRIGKVIGRNKPIGELKEFIGDEIITALWD